eukprot:352068-Chlamydomonas_euryale.AAC.12
MSGTRQVWERSRRGRRRCREGGGAALRSALADRAGTRVDAARPRRWPRAYRRPVCGQHVACSWRCDPDYPNRDVTCRSTHKLGFISNSTIKSTDDFFHSHLCQHIAAATISCHTNAGVAAASGSSRTLTNSLSHT